MSSRRASGSSTAACSGSRDALAGARAASAARRSATAPTVAEIDGRRRPRSRRAARRAASASPPTRWSSTPTLRRVARRAARAPRSRARVRAAPRRAALAVGGHLGDARADARASRCRATTCSSRRDYAPEFDDIFARAAGCPRRPRSTSARRIATATATPRRGRERLLCLVNAPADGDSARLRRPDGDRRMRRTRRFALLARCGLQIIERRPDTVRHDAGGFRAAVPGDGRSAVRPGVARLAGVVPAAGSRRRGFRGCTWRGAARIRARACRWRRCRAGWRRRALLADLRFDRTVAAGRLCLVVRRRAERRRPARPHAHRLHRQRVLALLRLRAPARQRGDPLRSLRDQRRALRPRRQALGDDRARPRRRRRATRDVAGASARARCAGTATR